MNFKKGLFAVLLSLSLFACTPRNHSKLENKLEDNNSKTVEEITNLEAIFGKPYNEEGTYGLGQGVSISFKRIPEMKIILDEEEIHNWYLLERNLKKTESDVYPGSMDFKTIYRMGETITQKRQIIRPDPNNPGRLISLGTTNITFPTAIVSGKSTKPFELAETEINEELRNLFREETGFQSRYSTERGNQPAANVTYNEARAICSWINEKLEQQGISNKEAVVPTKQMWLSAALEEQDFLKYFESPSDFRIPPKYFVDSQTIKGTYEENAGKEYFPRNVSLGESNHYGLKNMWGNMQEIIYNGPGPRMEVRNIGGCYSEWSDSSGLIVERALLTLPVRNREVYDNQTLSRKELGFRPALIPKEN